MVWYLSILAVVAFSVVWGFLILRTKQASVAVRRFSTDSCLYVTKLSLYVQLRLPNTDVDSCSLAKACIIPPSSSWVAHYFCMITFLRYISPFCYRRVQSSL